MQRTRRGILSLMVATSLFSINANATGIRFKGGAIVLPGSTFTIRSTERKDFDLTTLIAPFSDVGNYLNIAVSGAALSLNIWLMRTLTTGQSFNAVQRELLEYLTLQSTAATDGATAGTITITGYTGANGTGAHVSRVITVSCDNSPPLTWAMGADTRGQFGGYPLHQFMPGNPQNYTITGGNASGRFTLLKDATSRTELNSGITYANGFCRIVLDGNATNSMVANGYSGFPAGYGGNQKVPVTGGGTDTITVSDGSNTYAIVFTYVSGQRDIAPWPALEATNTDPDNPKDQPGYNTRITGAMAYNTVVMCEDGDYGLKGITGSGANWGFTTGFGTTTMSGTAPTGIYAANGRDYSPNPVFNTIQMTFRGRTPQGAYFPSLHVDLKSMNLATKPGLGWRFTRLKIAYASLLDSGGLSADFMCWDHNEIVTLQSGGAANNQSGSLNNVNGINSGIVLNWVRGSAAYAGRDSQFVANRIEPYAQTFDAVNYAGSSSAFHTNEATPYNKIVWNLWINKQGQDSYEHEDYIQANGTSPTTVGTSILAPLIYGNIIHRGNGRDSGSGYILPGGAEMYFFDDLTYSTNFKWMTCCNFADENVYWGIGHENPATGTRVQFNMMLYDYSNTAPAPGTGPPTIDMNLKKSGGVNNWRVADNVDSSMAYNIVSEAYISQTGGIDFANYVGNIVSAGSTWQNANLVNPTIGGAALDVADVIAAFKPKVAGTMPANPFDRGDLLDFRRHTANTAAIFALAT